MDEKAKEMKLTSLEKIRHIHLTEMAFTVENDLVTPTFKLKRNAVKKAFEHKIVELYAEAN